MVINMPPKKQTPARAAAATAAPAAAATAAPAAAATAAPAAAAAAAPAQQQQQMTEEQMTAKVLEDLRTSLQGKNFPAIINQAFARLKDKTKPHGPQLKEMHEALANIDLQSASRILRMIKGRPKGSAAVAATTTTPTTSTFTVAGRGKTFQEGAVRAKRQFLGSMGRLIGNIGKDMKQSGGFRTRRNLHNRKRTNKVKHRR